MQYFEATFWMQHFGCNILDAKFRCNILDTKFWMQHFNAIYMQNLQCSFDATFSMQFGCNIFKAIWMQYFGFETWMQHFGCKILEYNIFIAIGMQHFW